MAFLGAILFIVCAISVIYPLRFLMIPNRKVAICGVLLSFAIIGATAPASTTKSADVAEHKPAYTSSGGCKTDAFGDTKCSHATEVNLFGTTTRSTSEMKCGQNRVTLAYECKSESSSN